MFAPNISLKMFRYIFLGLCLNVSLVASFSLMDLQTDVEKGIDIFIQAKLTDQKTGKVWAMAETISTHDGILGKIELSSSDGQADVFYSFTSKYESFKRLVIHDNHCDSYMYSSDWNTYLPGVTSSFTNQILLIGPSLLYRLIDSHWIASDDQVIRGVPMQSVKITLAQKYNVTCYYQKRFDEKIGTQQPSRLVLTQYQQKDGSAETIIIDIYSQSATSHNLIQPTPGIGCPNYLDKDQKFPGVLGNRLHFIAEDTVNGTKRSLREIHADEGYKTLRLSEIQDGDQKKYVYDYNLGVYYLLSDSNSSCLTNPIGSTALGINSNGQFSISELLWFEGQYKYLGDVYLEHRANLKTSVWESVELNRVIGSGKYDKIVTTQYMSEVIENDKSIGFIVVSTSRYAYRKDSSSDKFILIDSLWRNFYDFGSDLPESAYHEAFQISDCFSKPDQRLTLTFHLTCAGALDCIKLSEDAIYVLKQLLVEKIAANSVSPLRIADVEFVFNEDQVIADVTFLEVPPIAESFQHDERIVRTDTIRIKQSITSKSPEECLRYHSFSFFSGRAIIYCEDDNLCVSTDYYPEDVEDLNSTDGQRCRIYNVPLGNLNRFGNELTLQALQETLISRIKGKTITLVDSNYNSERRSIKYEVVNIVSIDKLKAEQTQKLFEITFNEKKFADVDGSSVVVVPGVTQFGDCYRACSRSEDIPCETFSFCEGKEEKVCLVSIWMSSEISKDNLTVDANCKVYSKDHLLDYTLKEGRKFKHVVATPVELSLSECAKKCYSSNDCSSFEYCSRRCTFGGYYTESSTEIQLGCAIYMPKASKKYKSSGTTVISEVLHTELDIDIDQCAVLCNDWQSTDGQICKSFNYCPKGVTKSSCQLTAYLIKDTRNLTSESILCNNYENLSYANVVDNANTSINTGGTSGFSIAAIISFLFGGLIVGFTSPYLVRRRFY